MISPATVTPRRSVLYLPATNTRALEKARALACDALIIDLEDSVAPEAKDAARIQAVAAVRAGGFGRREVAVRINALGGPWGRADLEALATVSPNAIVVPKVSSRGDVERVAAHLATADVRTRLWAMMETPMAILNAGEIAGAARDPRGRLAAFVIGTNDLAKETRVEIGPDRTEALYWLSTVLTAGRAYGLDVVDGVYNDIKDLDGCLREAQQGRRLGMDGKSVIHPDQIAIANEAFSPSPTEIATAEAIVAAFGLPENRGKGVIAMGGRMVERLHVDMAGRTLALAASIGLIPRS